MGKSISGIRIAAAVLLLAPLIVQAAGLGRLAVTSALGQPLRAEIEIVSLQAGEEDSLIARIASPEAFRQAGMELSSALIGVQLAIQRRDGRPVIRIATDRPVNDPFLDLLVELQWASGKLVREYTVLLDPPELRKPKPVADAPTPAPAPEAKPAAATAAPVKPAAVEARPIPTAPAKAARTHEVKRGDTLAAVARTNKPEGASLNQMLIALYRANQDAFIQNNINLVRAGKILNVPERDSVLAVDAADATRLVQSQMSQFADYRRRLGAVVAAAPAAPAVREREAAGRIAAKPGAPAPAEPKEQLRLSKVDPAKPSAAPTRAAREDDRIARDRALKDAQSRVSDLEKNVADLQKLLEVKNRQLAELEKKGLVKPAPAPAAPPVPAPAKAPEAAKAPDAKPAPEAPKPAAEAPKPAPEAAKPAADAPKEAPKAAPDAAKAPVEVAKAKPKAAPAPPKPAPETGVIDEFLDNPAALGGLGGVLVLLIGYGAWAWRRKKAGQSQFQDSVLSAAGGAGAASMLSQAPAAASAPAPSIAPAPASAPSIAPAEPEEVDPIAEADVYMAYGRSAQAEEILKEAIGKDPNRIPVHAKLLEIYADRRDAKAFEQTALKLKNLTDGAGPQWEKAAALGRTVDPGNGLYGGDGSAEAAPAAEAEAPAPALDFDIGGGAPEPSAPTATAAQDSTAALDFDLGGGAAEAQKSDFSQSGTLIIDSKDATESTGLDFDLGAGTPAEKPAAGESTGGLDFELDTVSAKPEAPKAEAPAASSDPDATIAVGGMNFDLDLDSGVPKKEASAPSAEAPLDLGSISLDLGASEPTVVAPSGDAKWQEVATKLDLAKAYEEMGDKDGARELLNEVMKEGDAAQQGQAQQMLASLG